VPQQRATEGRVAAVAGGAGVEEGGLVPKDMQIGGRGGGGNKRAQLCCHHMVKARDSWQWDTRVRRAWRAGELG
jgi:hypothetical protein